MMQKWITLWQHSRYPLQVAFATLPVTLILQAQFGAKLLFLVWLLPLCFVVLDLLGQKVTGKLRLPFAIGAALVQLLWGLFFHLQTGSPFLWIAPVMYCILTLWGMAWDAEDRTTNLWFTVGLVLHIGAQLYRRTRVVANDPVLDPVSGWILAAFFLFALISFLSMNQTGLKLASSGRQSVPKAMQRKNLVMTLVFFAIAFIIALIPAATQAVSLLFSWIGRFLQWLSSLIPERQQTQVSESVPVQENDMLEILGLENSPGMPPWIQTVIYGILIAVAAAVVILVLYVLIRKLLSLLRRILANLNRYMHAVSEDYVDEITSTYSAPEDEQESRRKQRKLSVSEEHKLPPAERIRFRYRRLRQKHPQWQSGSTARETLPESAAVLYERARYSSHPVTEEDAQRFTAQTKKV